MAVTAAGQNGAAVDYVLGTRRTLHELGEVDPRGEEFAEKVTELAD